MNLLKSTLSIIAGFVLIGVLALAADFAVHAAIPEAYDANGRTENMTVLALALFYAPAFGVLGGYLTARLAPRNPQRHALILGLLGLAFSMPMVISKWNDAPAWYHLLTLLSIVPAAWWGGQWRERQLRRRPNHDGGITA